MTPWRWWLLLPLLMSSACSYAIVQGGAINERAAAKIERGLTEIRGLEFLNPVPMEVKSPEELRDYLQAELDREYSPEKIRDLQRVYERLGLLAPGVDLGEALLKLYTAQIAGFYDPRAGKLFLVPSGVPSVGFMVKLVQFMMRRDLVNEMLLAHELTHALQDQHFGVIDAADDATNDDRALTLHAVIEGDATLAGFAYLFGGLPEDSLLDLVERLGAVPDEIEATLPDTPPVLRDSLVFQYTAGSRFVSFAYLRGGWAAVDALLADPPSSTEQILWPEKYFARLDTPTDVEIGGLEPYRTDDRWALLEENTLGALGLRILLEGFVDAPRAERVAAGWDGDRFAAYGRDEQLHLYWMSILDSEAAAEELFSAAKELLTRKFSSSAAQANGDRVTAEGAEPYWLERRGEKVLIAIGVPIPEMNRRADEVWEKSVFAAS